MGYRSLLRWLGCVSLAWLVVGMQAGCKKQDVEKLGNVGRKTAAKVDGWTGNVRSQLKDYALRLESGANQTIATGGLARRVAQRIKWDRDLSGSEVQISSPAPGVIQLAGTVDTLSQRRRAMDLTRTTLGVKQVLDKLVTR